MSSFKKIFKKFNNFTRKNRYCGKTNSTIEDRTKIIGELFEEPEKVFDKNNPYYEDLTKYEFDEMKRNVKKSKHTIDEFVKISEDSDENKQKIKTVLQKVETSIILRCNSEEIFVPEVNEPSIDDILDTNGKAYLLYKFQHTKGGKSRTKKSQTKKSRTKKSQIKKNRK